jgi:hypothetical protein
MHGKHGLDGKVHLMRDKPTIIKELMLLGFLFLTVFTFVCGCGRNTPSPQLRAEINKRIMESLKESGVGDLDNRDKYNDTEYRDAYDKGYASGCKEGMADYKREETYSPSMTRFDSGRAMYDDGYKRGYYDGYYNAFEESIRMEEEAKQLPPPGQGTQADKKPGDYEIGSEYQAGYDEGYKRGRETGRLDKKAGYGYLPEPSNYDLYGSEEYQRGFKDGYAKGYEEGYYGN